MQVVTPPELEGREQQDYRNEDGLSRVTSYLGGPERDDDEPSAFLVQYRPRPGGAIRAHFHKIAQFQVVAGGGTIGKTPVPPISFQYADPSTPYGPIRPTAEATGIDFLTLRPVARPGIWWMPGAKREMGGRAGRNVAATVSADAPLPSGSRVVDLIERDDDGLAGFLVQFAADAETTVAVPPGAAGQYHFVTRGPVALHGRGADRGTLAFLYPGEGVALAADPAGSEALVLQFPGRIEP